MTISSWLRVAAAVVFLSVSAGSPAWAQWMRAESPHFIVYGDVGEGDLRSYVQKVERFDSLLRSWFPAAQSDIDVPPLTIYLADGRPEMLEVWPDMPPNVGGFYTAGDERIFAVTGGRGRENDHTLFHEYGHHFMRQYMNGTYPGWYVEGFAEFFATADLTPNRLRVGLHSEGRMNSLTMGVNAWMPMEDVLRSRSLDVGRRGHLYYAQSWALTHYFLSTPERRAKLGAYLAAIQAGGDPIDSLAATVGRTPAQLQDDVRRYVGGQINFLSQSQQFPPVEVTVERLSPAQTDLMWLDLRLARYVPEDRRAGNLAEAKTLHARYPGDALAGRVLAQAHLDMQQPDDAVSVMEPVASAHPDDPLTQRFLAAALMDAGDAAYEKDDETRGSEMYARARRALASAYQADATDYRTYIALNRVRQGAPGYPTANDLEVLRAGVALAPQVSGLRYNAGQVAMAKGLYDEAIVYLTPLANNPHGGDNLDGVRRLLAEALEKSGRGGAEDLDDPSAQPETSENETVPPGQ